jgi:exonuclease VII small subunit|tara:strand:- start:1972 stop:2145 length:174 start_codon:yes stop_codon:yes gene_type:complete
MSEELNYEALYNTAQQELVNAQHTIRVLVQRLQEKEQGEQPLEGEVIEAKADKKKPN